jgi:hypothetical protein
VYENNVLRKISGPKRDKLTGEWRRLQNKKLYDPYSSPNMIQVTKSRRMKWAGHVVCMGDQTGTSRVLERKPEGERPLSRPRHR